MMNEVITQINDALWGYVLIGVLVACGLWFTWKTRGIKEPAFHRSQLPELEAGITCWGG